MLKIVLNILRCLTDQQEVKLVKLLYSDEVTAYQTTIDGQQVMKKVDGIPEWKFPYCLLPKDKDYISIFKFGAWAEERCFPEERVDAKELLQELGLERYDRWEIVKKTNAVLTGNDLFSVDFS